MIQSITIFDENDSVNYQKQMKMTLLLEKQIEIRHSYN